MIPFQRITGGVPSQAGWLVDHLMNDTLGKKAHELTDAVNPETLPNILSTLAREIAQQQITMDEVVEALMARWDDRNPPPTEGAIREMEDKHTVWVKDRKGGHWAQTPDYVDLMERWEAKRDIAERLYENRLDVRVDRIERGLEHAHLAVVRPDTHPMVLAGLGIHEDGLLNDREISALMVGKRADGQRIEGKRYAVAFEGHLPIGSYAFIPTPDKTISVAWAMAKPDEQAKIMDAHLRASRDVMGKIAEVMGTAFARRSDGEPGYVTWLEFTHHTARPTPGHKGDMDIHTHFMIPNAVFCESGRVGSLNTAAFRRVWDQMDVHYNQRLHQYLDEQGFHVQMRDKTHFVEMTDVPREVAVAMSKRTENGRGNKDEIRDFANTRNVKDGVADFEDWRAQIKELAWEPAASFRTRRDEPEPDAKVEVKEEPAQVRADLQPTPQKEDRRKQQRAPNLDDHSPGAPKHIWEWEHSR